MSRTVTSHVIGLQRAHYNNLVPPGLLSLDGERGQILYRPPSVPSSRPPHVVGEQGRRNAPWRALSAR